MGRQQLIKGISSVNLGTAFRRNVNYLRQPHIIMTLFLLIIVTMLIIIPVITMFYSTFIWQTEDIRLSREANPGSFTFFHWKRVFSSILTNTILWIPLKNTIIVGIGVSFFALLIGIFMAWLVARTDIPYKKLISAVAVIPYMVPSYIHALSWLTLFKNDRVGGVTGVFQSLTGISPPNWISYGVFPIIVTLSLHYYPYAYLLVSAALKSIDSRLEESGEILGATRGYVLRRITLPLVMPAIFSSFILTFSRTIGIFSTPYFLGSPVRFFTIPVQIYSSIINRNSATGFILSFVLIGISSFIIFLNQRAVGERKSFATIGGKGFTITLTPVGKSKSIILPIVFFIIFISVVLPLLLLTVETVSLYPGSYSLQNLTSHFWIGRGGTSFAEGEAGLLRNLAILKSAWNSVRLAVTASILAGFLGIFIGYAVVKGRRERLPKVLDQISFLPYLVPSIAFSALYLALFIKRIGPIPALYGTFILLVMINAAKELPFSSRAGISSMLQIGGELEEAGEIAGAGWGTRFRKIIFPLSVRSSVAGFILVFITVMRELALIILLVTPGTRTLTTMTFRYQEQGYVQFSSAISLLLVMIIFLGSFLANRITKTSEIE
jgi:iron(III) transport system permease protein